MFYITIFKCAKNIKYSSMDTDSWSLGQFQSRIDPFTVLILIVGASFDIDLKYRDHPFGF